MRLGWLLFCGLMLGVACSSSVSGSGGAGESKGDAGGATSDAACACAGSGPGGSGATGSGGRASGGTTGTATGGVDTATGGVDTATGGSPGAGGTLGTGGVGAGTGGLAVDAGPTDAGAPPAMDAASTDGGTGLSDVPVPPDPADCTMVDFLAFDGGAGAGGFTVPPGEQLYCFGFHVALGTATHGIAFNPVIEHPGLLHHAFLYRSATVQTHLVTPCLGFHPDGELIAPFTPNAGPWFLPPSAAVDLGSGDFILEVHYDNTSPSPVTDASGVRVCSTAASRPNSAGFSWLGTEMFTIPPVTVDYPVTSTCTPPLTEPVHLISALPFTYGRGTRMTMEVHRAGGLVELGFDATTGPTWSQKLVQKALLPGDSLETMTHYTNTSPTTVQFGEAWRADEAGYNFVLAYPAHTLVRQSLQPNSCQDP